MDNEIDMHTNLLLLVDSGELITEREYFQRQAAQAIYRSQLLQGATEVQSNSSGSYFTTTSGDTWSTTKC